MQHASKPPRSYRWAVCLIGLYPPSWRERYAAEMLMILEDAPPTWKTVLNLFINLFDAYAHQNLVEERTPHMLQRKRFSELTIFGATMIFFLAWYTSQIRFGGSLIPRPIWFFPDPQLDGNYWRTMPFIYALVIPQVGWLLLLLLLLGGLPVMLAACWGALKARHYPALFLSLVALLSPLVTALFALVPFVIPYNIGADVQIIAWEFTLISYLGLGVDLVLLFFAIQQVPPHQRITHFALYPAMVVPFVMAVGLVALIIWTAPFLITAGTLNFPGALPYIIHEVLMFLIMGIALFFTILTLAKEYKAQNIALAAAHSPFRR
ncbi:MAG TPA: hypothetical protein VIY29_03815 [Ktedonobacteraceae bacterium]